MSGTVPLSTLKDFAEKASVIAGADARVECRTVLNGKGIVLQVDGWTHGRRKCALFIEADAQ